MDIKEFIKEKEALRTKPYKDQAGHLTVGYGHKVLPNEDFSSGISEEEADALFEKDFAEKRAKVDALITNDQLPDKARDAVTSLVFNIGEGAFADSTLLKRINEGKFDEASKEFKRWNKITVKGEKKESNGLTKRRKEEEKSFSDALDSPVVALDTPEKRKSYARPVPPPIEEGPDKTSILDRVAKTAGNFRDKAKEIPDQEAEFNKKVLGEQFTPPVDDTEPVEDAPPSILERLKKLEEKGNKNLETWGDFKPPVDSKEPPVGGDYLASKPSKFAPPVDTGTEIPETGEDYLATSSKTPLFDRKAAALKDLTASKDVVDNKAEEEARAALVAQEEETGKPVTDEDRINALSKVIVTHKEKITSMLDNIGKSAGQLGKSDRDYFMEKYSLLKDAYQENKKEIAKKENFEKFAHLLAQMAGAWYGLKNNVNMAGLKFDKTDWESKYNTALSEFKGDVGALDTEISLDRTQRREIRGDQEFDLRTEMQSLNAVESEISRIKEDMARAQLRADSKQEKADAKEDARKLKLLDRAEKEADDIKERTRKNINDLREKGVMAIAKKDRKTLYGVVLGITGDAKLAKEKTSGGWFGKNDTEAYDYLDKIIQEQLDATYGKSAVPPAPPATPAVNETGWNAEKEARYQELKAKKAKGEF